MAAGKPDPGARHESKLREEFAKHRRRVDGFGMAATDAYRRLLAAMEEHGDRWADELGSESNTAAERVTTLAVDLEKALADADGVARISDWLGAARRPGRVGGLPAPSGRTSSVNLGGSPWTRDAVLGALMASVTR